MKLFDRLLHSKRLMMVVLSIILTIAIIIEIEIPQHILFG